MSFQVVEGQVDTLQVTVPRCFNTSGAPLNGADVLTLKR